MRRIAFFLFTLGIGLSSCRQLDTTAAELDQAVVPQERVAASWKTTCGPQSDTHRTLLQSAVRIQHEFERGGRTITGHGTAFAVDLSQYGFAGRRFLITAAHNVLDENKKPYDILRIEIVNNSSTIWSRCRAVAWDVNLDLCIVEADEDMPALLSLSDADVPVGSPLIMAGSPRGIPVELFNATLEKKFEHGMLNYSARVPFAQGDSGGPIVDAASNRVVGVMVAGIPKGRDLDPNIGLFVPPVGIASFLDAHRRGSPTVPAPIPQQKTSAPADAIARSPKPAQTPIVATPSKSTAKPARAPAATAASKPATKPATSYGPATEHEESRTAAEKILDEFK